MDIQRGALLVFVLLYTAYALAYVSKRSAGFWGKDVLAAVRARADPSDVIVPLGAAEAGLFSSAFESFGGISKVLSGPIVDRFSATWILSASVGLGGLCHFAMHWIATAAPAKWASPSSLGTIWGINGFVQAFAWPALAKLFMAWFPRPETRGKFYTILATCMNAGGMAAPHLFVAGATYWPLLRPLFGGSMSNVGGLEGKGRGDGWQGAMLVPGSLLLATAVLIITLIQDKPGKSGKAAATDAAQPTQTAAAATRAPAAAQPAPLGVLAMARAVLCSRSAWLLGLSYFFNTALRNGVTEVPAWLLGSTGLRLSLPALSAAVSCYELGAVGGGLLAGWLSDRLFGGRRGPVIALLSFAAAPVPLLLLLAAPVDDGAATAADAGALGTLARWSALAHQYLPLSLSRESIAAGAYLLLGLASFGPHVLNGLATRELADPRVQASAGGFSKALGQLGGTAAGYPLGLLLDSHGWRAVVGVLAAAGVGAGLCALPLWNATAASENPGASLSVVATPTESSAAAVADNTAAKGSSTGSAGKPVPPTSGKAADVQAMGVAESASNGPASRTRSRSPVSERAAAPRRGRTLHRS